MPLLPSWRRVKWAGNKAAFVSITSRQTGTRVLTTTESSWQVYTSAIVTLFRPDADLFANDSMQLGNTALQRREGRCFINILSDDLFRSIFYFGSLEERDYEPYRPAYPIFTVEHLPNIVVAVCRHWRTIALAYAPLWSRIRLDKPHGVKQTMRWLQLSGHASLHVTLSCPTDEESEGAVGQRLFLHLGLLLPHIRRISSLKLRVIAPAELEYQFGPTLTFEVPAGVFQHLLQPLSRSTSFRQLRLHDKDNHGDVPITVDLSSLQSSEHSFVGMRMLDLEVMVDWSWPVKDLRVLKLWRKMPEEVFKILRESPQLEELSFLNCQEAGEGEEEGPPDTIERIDLLQLTSLTVGSMSSEAVRWLLQSIRAPRLTSFAFLPSAARAVYHHQNVMSPIIPLLPTVKHLAIHSAASSLSFDALGLGSAEPPLLESCAITSQGGHLDSTTLKFLNRIPRLKRIRLKGIAVSWEGLIEVVRRRQGLPGCDRLLSVTTDQVGQFDKVADVLAELGVHLIQSN